MNVYIATGGGLGDVIQTYLANPGVDDFPAPQLRASVWLRRLDDFKATHPGAKLKVFIRSHNPAAKDLFEFHPHIDETEPLYWHLPSEADRDEFQNDKDGYSPIWKICNAKIYKACPPFIYMTDDERETLEGMMYQGSPYITIQPFAGGKRQAYPIEKYIGVVDALIEMDYKVVVLGGSYITHTDKGDGVHVGHEVVNEFQYEREGLCNLVNKASARLSVSLVLNADGHIGTHSAMILPAWYARRKTVTIAPEEMREFLGKPHAVNWGIDKPFNRTLYIQDPGVAEGITAHDIVCFFNEAVNEECSLTVKQASQEAE